MASTVGNHIHLVPRQTSSHSGEQAGGRGFSNSWDWEITGVVSAVQKEVLSLTAPVDQVPWGQVSRDLRSGLVSFLYILALWPRCPL